MLLTAKDISTLMKHYVMTKSSHTGISSSNNTSTNKLYKAGLVVEYNPSKINRPLTAKGVTLAQLIIDYANEVQ